MENADLQQKLKKILEKLLNTYGQPIWRNPLPPIDELVSTILSQNTNDINRDRAFQALRHRFSTWESVRQASEGDIVETIRIAGLAEQKGPRIKAVLEQIHAETGGLDLGFLSHMPLEDARNWLLRFKGVGMKTAAIVLLFSLELPAFPVDTHIYRVTGRLGARPQNLDLEKTHRLLEKLINPRDYYAGHLNLIRLGREVCQARKPRCEVCPVASLCDFQNKTIKEIVG